MLKFAIITALATAALCAQQPAPAAPPEFTSPEVAAGRVTFRFYAPKATEVSVRGDFQTAGKRDALARDENGIWSVTVGPLPPQTYSYTFNVDGLSMVDPKNPGLKTGLRGPISAVEVPADSPMPWDPRKIPHGTLHTHTYDSAATGTTRQVVVYTPPGYEASKTHYPVLYLLHGSGDTEKEWATFGHADRILDSLIADGKAKPMLVVMPNGQASNDRTQNTKLFVQDLVQSVVPLVDKTYRTLAKQPDRALAGLSMGGGQSLAGGFENLDKFSQIGIFSSGLRGDTFVKAHETQLNDPATPKKLKLFWVACGQDDPGFAGATALTKMLDEHHIKNTFRKSEGGHTWINWRVYLSEFVPLLFR